MNLAPDRLGQLTYGRGAGRREVEVLVDGAGRLHGEPDPSREVTAIRVVADLAAVTEDVKRVLALEHLLAQVRNHVAHRELDVAAHDVVVAEGAALAHADAVEGPHDRVRKVVLLIRSVSEILDGQLLESVRRAWRRARELGAFGGGEDLGRLEHHAARDHSDPVEASAAPCTTWSQSIASSVSSFASLASPSTSRYRGSSS